ncbi:MAG TPA: hypothetical protein VKG38_14445 [Solirubrobacteraceae bacterium]|nr:hypothetical protein [Solirubrobacteraceae bacterium]
MSTPTDHDNRPPIPEPGDAAAHPPPTPVRPSRLPSKRVAAALSAAMLALGVGVGAAIGPSPESSFAGGASDLISRLPLLIASLANRSQEAGGASATAPAHAPVAEAATAEPRRRRRRRHRRALGTGSAASTTPAATAPAASGEGSTEGSTTPAGNGGSGASKLPPVTSVWLIELAGGTFTQASAQPSAAPFIDTQLLPTSTLLSGWSALEGSALASEAPLAVSTASGSPPPLLHSIVQPACPEGAAGAACAPETPGQLTAADEFLKATLAQITSTLAYREHGLVVVTFTTVGIASQGGLPTGASTATLTSQPPAGVAVLSPFARTGLRSSATFDPTSPVKSLEALLHR